MNSPAIAKHSVTRRQRALAWGSLVTVVAAVVGIGYWWRQGGREQVVLALQPDFTVAQIDRIENTMTVSRTNESYVVNCHNVCDLFVVGKKYSMMDRGQALEFIRHGQKIELPILKEHVDFETPPGGHG